MFSSFFYNTIRVIFSLKRREFKETGITVDSGHAPEPVRRAMGWTEQATMLWHSARARRQAKPSAPCPPVPHNPRDGTTTIGTGISATFQSRELGTLGGSAQLLGEKMWRVGSEGPSGRKRLPPSRSLCGH